METKAAAWVIRLGGTPLRDDERRGFEHWLTEHPEHRAAFDRARSTWADLAALKTEPGEIIPFRLRHAPVSARPMLGRVPAAVVVMLVGAGVGAFWYGNPLVMLTADYRTSPGESRSITLADGSTVQLDTASALAVHFDGHERRVELLAGEAYFTVTPMQGTETRPFVVEAANGTAKALGTQFMVARQRGGAQVTVAEHRVQVAAMVPNADRPGMAVLSPSQSVHYDRASGLGAITSVDLDQAAAWRRGRLVFDKVPLADVVAALNRYRRGRIVIADSSLAGRRVSGVFKTGDLTDALASITQELGVRTASVPPFVTLLY
jgi:transmembrane sensor